MQPVLTTKLIMGTRNRSLHSTSPLQVRCTRRRPCSASHANPHPSPIRSPPPVFGWNFSHSLVCGNATVWKPSESTSLCAIATTRIIAEVLESHKLPGALCGLVCGGGEVGQMLVDDKRVDLLSFTGSEARGKKVGQEVQARFGKSLLELGGNNVSAPPAQGRSLSSMR